MNNAENPQLTIPRVSNISSNWRNDEYSEVDDDFYEDDEYPLLDMAENCTCGAFRYRNGKWHHVSDCCC
jgi:hypothetical protein